MRSLPQPTGGVEPVSASGASISKYDRAFNRLPILRSEDSEKTEKLLKLLNSAEHEEER